jgi:quinol monooxygenase YgiN
MIRPMLLRIVRMTVRPDAIDTFLEHFDASASRIRARPGCEHLELWRNTRFPNICTTYSQWTGDDALQAYRASDLFQSTWGKVKPLFAAPPEAHSYTVARAADAIDDATA